MQSQKILEYLLTIPHSKVVTYKFLAQKFSLHPRTIAQTLKQNLEQDKYPCYKVIHSDGRIGGYNLGAQEKTKRLESDGIQVLNGKVDRKYFYED